MQENAVNKQFKTSQHRTATTIGDVDNQTMTSCFTVNAAVFIRNSHCLEAYLDLYTIWLEGLISSGSSNGRGTPNGMGGLSSTHQLWSPIGLGAPMA